ncbi:MAG: hypothetical protein ACI8P3_000925 [Saprospiraceae bacterium]|jgi:hypothetical protein
MNVIDLIGFIGVSLILIAYFLNLNNKLDTGNIKYILLNLIGAILACLASVLMEYYPFVLLEGAWTLVSVVALIRYVKYEKKGWRNSARKIDR